MDFSYATTTSEADWQGWVTRNLDVSDGGISLTRMATVSSSDIDESVRDIALGPTGLVYTLSSSGTLSQYDPNTESQRVLAQGESTPESTRIAASRNRVFVADPAEGSIDKLSLRQRRITGSVQASVSGPATLAFDRGTLYAVDDDGALVALGDGESAAELTLQSPTDIAVTGTSVYALDGGEDGPAVRVTEDATSEDPVLAAESFHLDGERFTPTAIAAPDDTLVVAGTFEDRPDGGLFEWDADLRRFSQLTTFEQQCHRLVGRAGRDGMRTFYAVVGENRVCRALSEVTENVRHPETDNHVGMAVTQYDAGVQGMEWHRLTFDLARSSVNTQVRVWYHAADDSGVVAFDGEDVAETDGGVASKQGAGATAISEAFSVADRGQIRSLGVDSLWELVRVDATELAARGDAVTAATVSQWQDTAFDVLAEEIDATWTLVDDTESQDILLDAATGRYLHVAIELLGTPTASPLVDSVRAYCPRQSYLRYMPELYQQDEESAAFLEQFLSVFETSFTDIQSEIDGITRYFDPEGSPTESLSWLEDWLAADEYRDWPESARREYLARAPELYKKRGTRAGLRDIIELYLRHATDGAPSSSPQPTGDDPTQSPEAVASGQGDTPTGHRLFFLDRADLDRVSGSSDGQLFESLLPTDRSFVVFCGPFESEHHQRAIETIVQTETPAHVDASVLTLESEFVLGQGTFLGLNAELGTQSFSLGEAKLGKGTYLGSPD